MKVYEVVSPEPRSGDASIIPLSYSDQQPIYAVLTFVIVLPLNGDEPLDVSRLEEAATVLLTVYPALAGRFVTSTKDLSIDVRNGSFPLSVQHLSDASAADVPGLSGFKDVATLPGTVAPRSQLFDIIGGNVMLDEPAFRLRATVLGRDSTTVLAASFHHAVADAKHAVKVMADLGRLYRGERLCAPPDSSLRTALRPEGLQEYAERTGAAIVKEALEAASKGNEPILADSWAEAWAQTFGSFDMVNRFWMLSDEPPAPAITSSARLRIPKSALTELHTAVTQYLSHDNIGVSRNDCLLGLLWAFNCISDGAPLPGQDPRAAMDIGFMIADLPFNGFPADLFPKPYYLGNTIKGLPFMADPGTGWRAAGEGSPPLLHAIALVAEASRRSIIGARESLFAQVVKDIMQPNWLHKHLETMAPLMNRGFTLRLLSTNWNRFDVAAIDFGGAGRASEVLPAYNMAETSSLKTITAAPDGADIVHMIMTDNGFANIAASKFFESVLPGADFV